MFASLARPLDAAGRLAGYRLEKGVDFRGAIGYNWGMDGKLASLVLTNAAGRALSVEIRRAYGRPAGWTVSDEEGQVFFRSLPFNQELLDKIKNHAKLLAEAIPPRSDAAGSQELMIDLEGAEACNMNLWAISPKWPSTRTGISFSEQNNRWLHGDYKDAPPFLTWTLYKNIRTILSNPEQTSEESR